ncbi:MAG: hypothetical protein ACLFVT_08065 [Syntrophobacteria bacterium]
MRTCWAVAVATLLVGLFLIGVPLTPPGWALENLPPVLLHMSPRGGETIFSADVELWWQPHPHSGATEEYRLEIARDPDFDSRILSILLPGWSYRYKKIDNIVDDGDYYWRIKSRPRAFLSWSDWSETAHFVLDFDVPAPEVVHPAPSEDVALHDRRLTFSWRKIRGVKRYRLVLTHEPTFYPYLADVTVCTSSSTGIASYTLEHEFSEDEYYWRVAPYKQEPLGGYWSSWSPPVRFYVTPRWHPVRLLAPENGGLWGDLRPVLSWHRVPDVSQSYEVQWSKTRDFSDSSSRRLDDDTSMEFDYDLENDTTYYWRVRLSSEGWSTATVWSFRICARPEMPTLVNPEPGSRIRAQIPALIWEPVPYSYCYDLTLTQGSLDGPLVLQHRLFAPASFIVCPRILSPGTRYVWQIRACNAENICSGYQTGWFEVMERAAPATRAVPSRALEPPKDRPLER